LYHLKKKKEKERKKKGGGGGEGAPASRQPSRAADKKQAEYHRK